MNVELPKEVTLIEVGPRDGFQFEKKYIVSFFLIQNSMLDVRCSMFILSVFDVLYFEELPG